MTSIDMTPLNDGMLSRLSEIHRPTYDYITERRANGVPTRGKPFEGRKPIDQVVTEYRAPRLTKEHCAAEFWKACVDLAFTAQANPDYEQVRKEVETWRRFATQPNAFN